MNEKTRQIAESTMESYNVTEISKLRNISNAAFLAPKCLVKSADYFPPAFPPARINKGQLISKERFGVFQSTMKPTKLF